MKSLAHRNNHQVSLHETKQKAIIQPKLMVNAPGDEYEQEADAMAEEVMQVPEKHSVKSSTSLIGSADADTKVNKPSTKMFMRKADGVGGFEAPLGVVSKLNATGNGSHLTNDTRNFMENAFSADFSSVRVHTDSNAAMMNNEISAKAFTHGNDIYFNSGRYAPNTSEGKGLLAHELVHTQQQNGNPVMSKSDGDIMRTVDDQLSHITSISSNGHSYPEPVIVHWSEPFRLTFSVRTTTYGDVHFIMKIRYLGNQVPDSPGSEEETIEVDPFMGDYELGKIHDRKIDAYISLYAKAVIEIDLYGDGSSILRFIEREPEPPTPSGGHRHTFDYWLRDSHGKRIDKGTIVMTSSPGSQPFKEDTEISITPVGAAGAGDSGNRGLNDDFNLSARTILQISLQRLYSLGIQSPPISMLESRVVHDLTDPDFDYDSTATDRVSRFSNTINSIAPVFTILADMAKPEKYIDKFADVVVAKVYEISSWYAAALYEAYDTSFTDSLLLLTGSATAIPHRSFMQNKSLEKADEEFSMFPGWLNRLYLHDPEGITKLIAEIPKAQEELRAWRKNNDGYSSYSTTFRTADEYTQTYPGYYGTDSLEGTLLEQRNGIERRWRERSEDVNADIHELYYNVQKKTGMINAMILYEQASYFSHHLDTSFVTDLVAPALSNFGPMYKKWAYADVHALREVIFQFENSVYDKDGNSSRQTVKAAFDRLAAIMPELQTDFDLFQSFIKWNNRIDVLGKLAIILAAAALTGGIAGAIGGEAFGAVAGVGGLELGSTGVAIATWTGGLLAEGIAFTTVSRVGQSLLIGGPQEDYSTDLFWNLLTLGVLKGVNAGYTKWIKISEEATKFGKLAHGLGRTATSMISLYGFSEVQHRLMKGEWMDKDQRGEAVLQNIVLTVALSAGHFITEPISKRITPAIFEKLGMNGKVKTSLEALKTERASVDEKLKEILSGQGKQELIADLLTESQNLWAKELKILNDASNKKIINEGELTTALASYKGHIAELQFHLSKLGVDYGGAGATFRPSVPGIVTFKADGMDILQKAYAENPADSSTKGSSLTESKVIPGAYEGRLPNGEITFYLPVAEPVLAKGAAPKTVGGAKKILTDAGLNESEMLAFEGPNAKGLSKTTANRISVLAETFSAADLKALGEYLSNKGTGLDDAMANQLTNGVMPGNMKAALNNMELAAVRNKQSGIEIDYGKGQSVVGAGPTIIDLQSGTPVFLQDMVSRIPGSQGIGFETGDWMLGYQKINPTYKGDLSMARQLVQNMPIWPDTSISTTPLAEMMANPTKGWFEGLDPLTDMFPQNDSVSTRTEPFFPAVGNDRRLIPIDQADVKGLKISDPPQMKDIADQMYWRRPFALEKADAETLQAMGKQIGGLLKTGGFVEFRILKSSDKGQVAEIAKEIPGAEIVEIKQSAIKRFLEKGILPDDPVQAEILKSAEADLRGEFSPKGTGIFNAIIRIYKR